jgi:hypothetical protein
MDSVQIRQEAPTISYQNPGVPAFGPNNAGVFGTGTGVAGFPQAPTYLPADDPNNSGIWIYNNGYIDARSPGFANNGVQYPQLLQGVGPPDRRLRPQDQNYPAPADPGDPAIPALARERMLGRFFFTRSNNAADPDPDPPYTFNIGSFQMDDVMGQIDNPPNTVASDGYDSTSGRIDATTRVSWRRLIDGTYNATYGAASNEVASQLFSGAGANFHKKFENKLFGPSVEIGFQSSSFFSVFMGASMFTLDNSIARSSLVNVPFGRRGFIDTFSFFSDHHCADSTNCAVKWYAKDFNSATRIPTSDARGNPQWNTQGTIEIQNGVSTADEMDYNYTIWPDGPGQGVFPIRQFFDHYAPGVQDTVQEDVTHGIDMEIYETRLGGRSWFPLFGMGRIAVGVGGTFSPIRYRIRSSRLVTSLGPNGPGTVLDFRTDQAYGWWWNFGAFLSGDLEFQVRNFIARASAEYVLCTSHDAKVIEVQTSVNPGGMGATLSAGIAF